MHPYFLLFIFATYSDAQLQTTGTIFKVDHFQDGGIFEDTKVALQIQKSLHLCSMTNNCTGIVKEEQRETLDFVSDKDHLALKEKEFFISKDRLSDAPIIFSTGLCQDAYAQGHRRTTTYLIQLSDLIKNLPVRCDMENGGWIIIQRRTSMNEDFNREWKDYKAGFGSADGDYWLGLENMHKFLAPGNNATVRIDMKHATQPNKLGYAQYEKFEISSEGDAYRLTVDGYSGNAGNALSTNKVFATKDRDTRGQFQCAKETGGGWWFHACSTSNLNAMPPPSNSLMGNINWYTLQTSIGGITFSEMKLKYRDVA